MTSQTVCDAASGTVNGDADGAGGAATRFEGEASTRMTVRHSSKNIGWAYYWRDGSKDTEWSPPTTERSASAAEPPSAEDDGAEEC